MAVDDRQGPPLLSAVRLSRGPVGPHVAFLALEQEALVPEKLPAWRRERYSAESIPTYEFIILNLDTCLPKSDLSPVKTSWNIFNLFILSEDDDR